MKRRRKKRSNPIRMLFILVGILLLLLMSPLFSINEITISGNQKFSIEEIAKLADVSYGMNVFRFSYSNAEKKLMRENYIKAADISITLPNQVKIDVIERKVSGNVPHMGTYLYIDSDGFVLENNYDIIEDCPIVTGLIFSEFSVGEPLSVENTISFDIVITMAKLLQNYDYLDEIREMNISAPDNIHLYIDSVDVSFGDINDADKKIRTVIEIMTNLQSGEKGILHVEDLTNTPYFTYTL